MGLQAVIPTIAVCAIFLVVGLIIRDFDNRDDDA